jgi:hypothetical protein
MAEVELMMRSCEKAYTMVRCVEKENHPLRRELDIRIPGRKEKTITKGWKYGEQCHEILDDT